LSSAWSWRPVTRTWPTSTRSCRSFRQYLLCSFGRSFSWASTCTSSRTRRELCTAPARVARVASSGPTKSTRRTSSPASSPDSLRTASRSAGAEPELVAAGSGWSSPHSVGMSRRCGKRVCANRVSGFPHRRTADYDRARGVVGRRPGLGVRRRLDLDGGHCARISGLARQVHHRLRYLWIPAAQRRWGRRTDIACAARSAKAASASGSARQPATRRAALVSP